MILVEKLNVFIILYWKIIVIYSKNSSESYVNIVE